MADGIRIDELSPTNTPSLNHALPAMNGGLTVHLTVGQIAALSRIAIELPGGTDFHTVTSDGLFTLTSNVNAPVSGSRWLLWSMADPVASGNIFHQAMRLTGGGRADVYTNRASGGVFEGWVGGLLTADQIPYAGSGFPGANDVEAAIDEAANYTGFVQSETTLQNFVYGLTLSNNSTDANNDIDIATGQARGNSVTVTNSAALTKRLDASWAVGSGNGGLDTGSKANSTTYHVHAIRRNSDGVFDALFSTSVSSPTMPSGWTRVQRLGAALTDGSGNIRAFVQDGNEYRLNTTNGALNYSGAGNRSKSALSCTLPSGVRTLGIFLINLISQTSTLGQMIVYDGENQNIASPHGVQVFGSTPVGQLLAEARAYSNTSAQIQLEVSNGNASTASSFHTLGWIDYQIPRI